MLRWSVFLALGSCLFSCATQRTPCDQTIGAHQCSITPEHYTCECDGHLDAPNEKERLFACGHVHTVCVGRVKSRQHRGGAPGLELLRATDAGTGD